MPRAARIDAPGAVHHIIARGIERGKIFKRGIVKGRALVRYWAVRELGMSMTWVAEF